jgi:hypothetical protein
MVAAAVGADGSGAATAKETVPIVINAKAEAHNLVFIFSPS